ncbi:BREX-2 system phosphatase PglZ [Kitasatospora cineracea]|uniref:PglZ domain-containing protein n=1 Tax=Kitasatospora cineracea TaxID=88074 RepID=A0A8G1UE23_9ACTN|nr:BREX-2 system phosphatase PglZ [Kitasatospora cineracea]ROR38156.1 PglZ domain-containing protein [Kitasatospora cineracea]
MSTPVVTSAVRLNTATVTQYLASQSGLAAGRRKAVLLRATPEWDGPAELGWGERRARIAAAPSALAVYELVLTHLAPEAPGPEVLVVLTDREESELGPDLLARVHKQRVNAVDTWDVVRQAFGAGSTDNRLLKDNWAAEALLDATPPAGWPQLAGGVLSRRGALGALALRRLGIGRFDPDRDERSTPDSVLDVPALLRWSLTPGGPDRFLALRAPERSGLAGLLGEADQAGLTGRALLALVEADHGPDAVAFGLVCAALWVHADAAADAEDYRARGRAERWFGDEPPAHGEALDALVAAFGRSCEEFVSVLLLSGRSGFDDDAAAARRLTGAVLDRAASLVEQLGAQRAAESSPVLATGLEARFAAVGRALGKGDPARTAAAVKALGDHRLAPGQVARTRVERTHMAQRLAQWLATDPATESTTVAAGIDRHLAETAWVDLALEHVEAGGDPNHVLKSAYDELCTSIRARRREIDRRFAQTLATWTAAGTDPGSMLTVETFLPRVVGPVVKAAERRLLLVVVDGMSAAIATELGAELREHWAEYDPYPRPSTGPGPEGSPSSPQRRAIAAALPTITSVSRTSLFAAKLMKGSQADEKRIFPTHRFWGGQKVAVFHKDDLRSETGGDTFGPELSEALAGDTHVAVVLNTVDDRLAKEQKLGDGAWRLSEIGGLQDLLSIAATQGRAVILTSDHGHVVDRRGLKVDRDGAASARHRAPGGPLADNEIVLSGPRVISSETGGEIVALWDADSRYTALKAGYHGGASLAEFAIPVLALLPFGAAPPKGWRELGSPEPEWWAVASGAKPQPAPVAVVPPKKATKPARSAKAPAQPPAGHDALFEVALAPSPDGETLLAPTVVSPQDTLVSGLLASQIFLDQVDLLARKPDLAKVEKAVHVLLDAGGTLPVTALAQRIGLLTTRADGFAAVLRQLLNYDSIQVLETLPDGRTLRLDTGLLRTQFGLK